MPAGVTDEPLFGGETSPGTEDLLLAPRHSTRSVTRTSEAFGAVEVGPPVSRLAPEPEPAAVRPLPATERPERCPSCDARVRAEQDWCSLCHASLLPAPTPPSVTAPVTTPVSGPRAVRVLEDADGQLALDFDEPRAQAPAVDEEEVARMLGVLARSDERGLRGLRSRQAKLVVAIGGGLGLTALLLGGMTALGAVFG